VPGRRDVKKTKKGELLPLRSAAEEDAIVPYAVNSSLVVAEILGGVELLDVEIDFL
jgi:hypothetical protein